MREPKTQLPLTTLKKVWGEAVSYVCGLKEDYSRLFQGQRAAMYVIFWIVEIPIEINKKENMSNEVVVLKG